VSPSSYRRRLVGSGGIFPGSTPAPSSSPLMAPTGRECARAVEAGVQPRPRCARAWGIASPDRLCPMGLCLGQGFVHDVDQPGGGELDGLFSFFLLFCYGPK
jgi:hypothetical protein